MITKFATLTFLIAFACCVVSRAQFPITYPYFLEQTLTSFEELPLYFTPASIEPQGAGIFKAASQALPGHPLRMVADNPARLTDALTGRSAIYLQTSTLPEQHMSISPYSTYPCANCHTVAPYTMDRTVTEPAVSIAAMYRPERENRLTLGLLWQVYRIRQNYSGAFSPPEGHSLSYFPEEEDGPMQRDPISTFDQNGHLPVLLASWKFSPTASAGVRIGYAWYRGEGLASGMRTRQYSAGLENNQTHETAERDQYYTHFDLSAGIELALSSRYRTGIAFGYLAGSAEQAEFHLWDIDWKEWESSSGGRLNVINRNRAREAVWQRDGHTLYGAADLFFEPDEGHIYRLFYRGRYNTQTPEIRYTESGLEVSSGVYQNNRGEETYEDYYRENSVYSRGSGDLNIRHHTLGVQSRFRLSGRTVLTLAAQAGVNSRNSSSAEEADGSELIKLHRMIMSGEILHQTETQSPYTMRQAIELDRRDFTLYIPIVFEWQISGLFAVEAAMMPAWQSSERTTGFISMQGSGTTQDEVTRDDFFEMDHSTFRVHPWAAVQVSPGERVSFRLASMPENQELASMSYSSKTDTWRLVFSMEVHW